MKLTPLLRLRRPAQIQENQKLEHGTAEDVSSAADVLQTPKPLLLFAGAFGRLLWFGHDLDHFHAAVKTAVSADLVRAALLAALGTQAQMGRNEMIVSSPHVLARYGMPSFWICHDPCLFNLSPRGDEQALMACVTTTKAAALKGRHGTDR
jgi:hypothetical protein